MLETDGIPDAEERYRALDPRQSFIVQAPAGSGKTSLLIQRYLSLLACVDAPEEIVAITFTRKAAAEMRARVLAALQTSEQSVIAESSHGKLNRELAIAVLQRDRQAGWCIAGNPERLRIQTIDSLCAALTRQMPVLSQLGAQPDTIEDATDYYLEAARATLKLMEQDIAIANDVALLLEHLDNDQARVESLLAEMLARRDHWLRHLHGRTREELEASLQNSRRNALQRVLRLLPETIQGDLLHLLHYAAANLIAGNKMSPITDCAGLLSFAEAGAGHWQGIAELLLTKHGTWRKRISVNEGFPPGDTKIGKDEGKIWKGRFEAVIEMLSKNSYFQLALQDVRQLPPPCYSEQQWEILGTITRLLPYATAQLKVIFQASGYVDFSEVAQRAALALGDSETPTDLALALDYRIKHLLIDEFQDTSISQFELIEKLVAGWEEGDGRSLFVVGDPMQSIYRFREAEVGLFLQARYAGIGSRVLQPVTLNANFRSQQGIIDWVNETFTRIMPGVEDVTTGAVTYTPSIATHPALTGDAVSIYPAFERDLAAEASAVAEIIQQTRQHHPDDSIAILVRNRSHLQAIVLRLQKTGIRFRAIDIESLDTKPVVQDLLALTRALINLADRLAWFALLRAPWCGLRLSDITILADVGSNEKATVWERIGDESLWQGIPDDAKIRLRRLREILVPCVRYRQRQSLRATVEAAWYALGGVGCADCTKQDDASKYLDDAMIYLDYLEDREVAGTIPDLARFEDGLTGLYASPDLSADGTLQIMTIHKAKGLEFDTVIVPGLGRAPRSNQKQLLKWIEQPHYFALCEHDKPVPDLLLAPIQKTGAEVDSIYAWLEKLDCDKGQFESDRLLYVAATRAKKFLHLLGHVEMISNNGEKDTLMKPVHGSLLARLWPIAEPRYLQAADNKLMLGADPLKNNNRNVITKNSFNQNISRLNANWHLLEAPRSVMMKEISESTRFHEEIDFFWVSDMARHVGNIVHRWLQQIAEDGLDKWTVERIRMMRNQYKMNLLAGGMSGNDVQVEEAIDRVVQSLTKAITDKRGRWILGSQLFAQNELKITAVAGNQPANWVIDRTFCDSNGVRWIIDYKISSHEGSNLQEFLNREQLRYQQQLNHYAKLMRQLDSRPIRLGLYFPLISGWREWGLLPE